MRGKECQDNAPLELSDHIGVLDIPLSNLVWSDFIWSNSNAFTWSDPLWLWLDHESLSSFLVLFTFYLVNKSPLSWYLIKFLAHKLHSSFAPIDKIGLGHPLTDLIYLEMSVKDIIILSFLEHLILEYWKQEEKGIQGAHCCEGVNGYYKLMLW